MSFSHNNLAEEVRVLRELHTLSRARIASLFSVKSRYIRDLENGTKSNEILLISIKKYLNSLGKIDTTHTPRRKYYLARGY